MSRKPPTLSTVKRLFAISGNQCAEPKCQEPIISLDGEVVLGEICHISAANPKGPRYDNNIDDEYRRSYDNLLLLCESHHKIVDANPQGFPIEKLKEWKKSHEEVNKSKKIKINDNEASKIISKSFNNNSGIINKVNSTGDNQQVHITNTINHNNRDNIKKGQLTKIAEVVGIISAICGIFFAIIQFGVNKDHNEEKLSKDDNIKIENFSSTTRELKVLSKNSFSFNYEGLIFNFSIDNNLNTIKTEDSLYPSNIQYAMNAKNDTVFIKPYSIEIDQINKNEVLTTDTFYNEPKYIYENGKDITCNFDIKITNNSNKVVFFNKIETIYNNNVVKEPLLIPLIYDNKYIVLKNVGWGKAKEVKLKTKVLSINDYNNKNEKIILEDVTSNRVIIGDTLSENYYYNILDLMKAKDSSYDLFKCDNYEDHYDSGYNDRNPREYVFSDPEFIDFNEGIIIVGEYSYNNGNTDIKVKFKSDRFILHQCNVISSAVSLAKYSLNKRILLKSDNRNDTLIVPISMGIKSNDFDRMSLNFLSDKRSVSEFIIKFYYNDKIIDLPLVFSLDYFITPELSNKLGLKYLAERRD